MLTVQSQSSEILEPTTSNKPLSKASEISMKIRERVLQEYSQQPGNFYPFMQKLIYKLLFFYRIVR